MNARLTVITALLGSLIVVLSQVVTAYSLEDQFGIAMANVTLFEKHGPLTAILAVVAGLAVIFLITAAARTSESGSGARASSESRPVALAAGIVVGGMGIAVILVFLFVDLPDIGDTGLYNAPGAGNLDATGTAAAGLWMELVGGVILLLAGAALATLKPEQLATIAPERSRPAKNS